MSWLAYRRRDTKQHRARGPSFHCETYEGGWDKLSLSKQCVGFSQIMWDVRQQNSGVCESQAVILGALSAS